MKFITRAVLLAIVLSSATECKSLKSNLPSGHCLDLCTGVWRACMTSCDRQIRCMECTISVTECREQCLPRRSRQWRGREINFFVLYLLLQSCIRLNNCHSLAILCITIYSGKFLLVCICFNLCQVRKNDKEPNVCYQDYRTSQFNFLLRKNSHKALKETKYNLSEIDHYYRLIA